jgi:hypothetical protein
VEPLSPFIHSSQGWLVNRVLEYAQLWMLCILCHWILMCPMPSASHLPAQSGGAKVLDGLGSSLHLDPWHLEPSRAVLRFYGNVSSASTW